MDTQILADFDNQSQSIQNKIREDRMNMHRAFMLIC